MKPIMEARAKAATDMARALGDAGEVIEKCDFEVTLLDPDRNLTQHLAVIHALPESCWPVAVRIMLDKGWSVCKRRFYRHQKPTGVT